MKTGFLRLFLGLLCVATLGANGQQRVYLTNVASEKATKIYFETYSSETENWVHFTDSPHKAEIKVYIKPSCMGADIEVVDHIDNRAKWIMVTHHPSDADKRLYVSSYYNKDAKEIHISESPYGADVVICMDKDRILRELDSRDRKEELQKIIAALLFTKLFEPEPEIAPSTMKEVEFIHEDLESAGNRINRIRELLAPAITYDSVKTNLDRLSRIIEESQKVSYVIDSVNQSFKQIKSDLYTKCSEVSSPVNKVLSDNEVTLLDLRDAERRLEMAIKYNDSEGALDDLIKALEYYDNALKRTIASISRIEDIHQVILDCR